MSEFASSLEFPMSDDRILRSKLIRLAHTNPALRPHLIPILKDAGFSADNIGKQVPGPMGGPGSDAQKSWAKGEFTQQENAELDKKQEGGQLADGKADGRGVQARRKTANRR